MHFKDSAFLMFGISCKVQKKYKRNTSGTTERYDYNSYLNPSGSSRCFFNIILAICWHFESSKLHAHLAASCRRNSVRSFSVLVLLYDNLASILLKILPMWSYKSITKLYKFIVVYENKKRY